MTSQVVIGRDPGCDVVIAVPAVSSQHARLSWHGGQLVLEDLGSANGTYVNGERVSRVAVKPGTDVRLAEAPLPWGDPRIAALVRLGSSRSTIVAMPRFGRYVCPQCKTAQVIPAGFVRGEISCPSCQSALEIGTRSTGARVLRAVAGTFFGLLASSVFALVAVLFLWPERLAGAPDPIGEIARRRMGPRVVASEPTRPY